MTVKINAVVVLLTLLGCDRGEYREVAGYHVHWWEGVTEQQAGAVAGAIQEYLQPKTSVTLRVWREPSCFCVRVMSWDGKRFQQWFSKPGASLKLSKQVFGAAPTCAGLEQDSGVAFELECTAPAPRESCVRPRSARNAPRS